MCTLDSTLQIKAGTAPRLNSINSLHQQENVLDQGRNALNILMPIQNFGALHHQTLPALPKQKIASHKSQLPNIALMSRQKPTPSTPNP